jgi:hypothetical protein
MVVAPLGTALFVPVSAVAPISRVVRRAKSTRSSRTSGADGEGEESPIAAMKTPAEASSSATQAALTKLELGG